MKYEISGIGLNPESFVDGTGNRVVLYCAGCEHECYNCHNPDTWDINNGSFLSVQGIYDMLMADCTPLTTGITFTGGDPMYQAAAFGELAKMIKANTKYDIWCYTGYTFEEIINSRDEKYELLKNIDVLVDGRYIDKLRDLTLAFRGSSNQKIIDVKQSLKQNTAVERIIKSSPRKTRKFMI